MLIEGKIELRELLEEIGLHQVPRGCDRSMDDTIVIQVTVDDDEVVAEMTELGYFDRELLPLNELKDAFEALIAGQGVVARALFGRMLDYAEARIVEDATRRQGVLSL